MAGAYKTPGVYIVEKNAFPNSVVEVATAVPAFIGYTRFADNKGSTLHNKPWRITSMSEFTNYFGGPSIDKYDIAERAATDLSSDFKSGGKEYSLVRDEKLKQRFYLYHSMMLFFQNGGGPCYIVSIGNYDDGVKQKPLQDGIDLLLKEQEPTMVVIPDAMSLDGGECISLQQYSLKHCGSQMRNRFAILDVYNGFQERTDPSGDCIAKFRDALGTSFLNYSAAYYPWLNTAIVQTPDLDFGNFSDLAKLNAILLAEVEQPEKDAQAKGLTLPKAQQGKIDDLKAILKQVGDAARDPKDAKYLADDELHKILFTVCPSYANILLAMKNKLNLLPPAAAMAGVYTMVDNSRGVWKAPANVSLSSVISPAVNITHDEQEDLNVTTAGKSINAIRAFIGEGTLVWGGRTLDGNSLDWRYINVRRTMIMLEESIRLASKAYVFEPNVANTWVTMKSMIRNFLTGIWKRGGLAGASPDDAFGVFVGLGETMTPEDILEGIMRITVLVAISRPAEFIEITFQQQMQKS